MNKKGYVYMSEAKLAEFVAKAVAAALAANAQPAPQPAPETPKAEPKAKAEKVAKPEVHAEGVATIDRNWTWVTYTLEPGTIPDVAIRTALKGMGGFYRGKRQAWEFRRQLTAAECKTINAKLTK